jgi:hypothetical protein
MRQTDFPLAAAAPANVTIKANGSVERTLDHQDLWPL